MANKKSNGDLAQMKRMARQIGQTKQTIQMITPDLDILTADPATGKVLKKISLVTMLRLLHKVAVSNEAILRGLATDGKNKDLLEAAEEIRALITDFEKACST